METSEYIAGLIGPVLMVTALSMLLNPDFFKKIAAEAANSFALIYLAGIAALTIGLVIVHAHNTWVWDWPVIITIFGWLAIAGGLFRILAPQLVIKIAQSMLDSKPPLIAGGVVALLLGTALTAFGYGLIT